MAWIGLTLLPLTLKPVQGGGIAFYKSEYLVLDRTPTSPRLIRITPGFDSGVVFNRITLPGLAVTDIIELPPNGDYYGIGASSGSIVVLNKKLRYCNDGEIAIGELLTIDIANGNVLNVEELRARKRVILTGGLANVESNWFFLAKDGSNTYFYETTTNNAIIQRSQFTPAIADRSALGYDTRNRTVYIINLSLIHI